MADQLLAVRSRTTLLQDNLREAIQRVALESRSPGGSDCSLENEHECLVAVRTSLDDLESIVTDMACNRNVDLLHLLERTRHELSALASRGLTYAVREKAVLHEVLEFVEIKEGGEEAGGEPAAPYYEPNIYSSPPSVADRIMAPKQNPKRLSPTSVLFEMDSPHNGGFAGIGGKGAEAEEYFDRTRESPSKSLFQDDRRGDGWTGAPASSPGRRAVEEGLAVEEHEPRRGGLVRGIAGLVRLGFFVGGVGYIISRLQPRAVKQLSADVAAMARSHPLVARLQLAKQRPAGQRGKQPQRHQARAVHRPHYEFESTNPFEVPGEDGSDEDISSPRATSRALEPGAGPTSKVVRERSTRPTARAVASHVPSAPLAATAPDIFFGQG